jgi:hypothetical protein
MVFDLGLAMRKKEELESARLIDFEFMVRARAARLLARSVGLSETAAAGLVATIPEEEMPERIAELAATPVDVVRAEYQRCLAEARDQLVAQRGDPTPHRLA